MSQSIRMSPGEVAIQQMDGMALVLRLTSEGVCEMRASISEEMEVVIEVSFSQLVSALKSLRYQPLSK